MKDEPIVGFGTNGIDGEGGGGVFTTGGWGVLCEVVEGIEKWGDGEGGGATGGLKAPVEVAVPVEVGWTGVEVVG